jgi:hypothetical protein
MGSCLLLLVTVAKAQVSAAPAQSNTPAQSKTVVTVPRVPGLTTLFSGVNAGVSLSSVHNSAIGWYSVLTPAVSYTFSTHYSADASTSIYLHRRVLQGSTPRTQQLVVEDGTAGDTLIGLHATYIPGSLIDTVSAYLSAPTGDQSAGLGAGKVTFDFTNHLERYHNQVGFLLDLGVGNSSVAANSLLNRNFSSVGGLGDFQTGAILWLPRHSYFEAIAYEQLPFGSQTVYTSDGEHEHFPQQIVTGTGFAEDNGFVTFVGIPLAEHFTFSGYYNRSLRRQTDTVSFGITWVLRRPARESDEDSMVDRAIREAEKGSAQQ